MPVTSKNDILIFSWGKAYLSEKMGNTPTSSFAHYSSPHHYWPSPSILLPASCKVYCRASFLKYIDTNLVLRIFKNLSKSLTVTGNILGCCKFRVGDYCGRAKAMTIPLTTSGKVLLWLFCLSNSWWWLFLHRVE